MNQTKCEIRKRPRGWALTILLGGSVVVAGCFLESRQNQITGPGGGEEALKSVLSSLTGTGMPQGSYLVSGAPPSEDLFLRTSILGCSERFGLTVPDDCDGSTQPLEDVAFGGLDWGLPLLGAADDPRLPALQGTGTEQAVFGMGNGAAFGDPSLWTYFSETAGLDPAGVYVALMYRAALIVNGEIDHLQVVRGEAVTEPDEWVLLGTPNPSTDIFGCADQPTTNPCSGTFPQAGPGWFEAWFYSDFFPGAPNSFETFDLPYRNLVVLHEYNGPDGFAFDASLVGDPVLRQQIGVALDLNGDPVPNSFGPTPTELIPPEGIFMGSFEFRGLAEPAAGGGYALWSYNSVTGEFITQVAGNWTASDPDEGIVFLEQSDVDLITGLNNSRARHVFEVDRATFTGDWITEGDHVVVTLEGQGQSPGPIVMWAKIKDDPADVADATLVPLGPLSFGTLSTDYRYSYSGSGTAFFFGDELRFQLKNLSRPPVGYFYEAWLSSGETDFSLGALTTPYPDYASLLDADIQEGGVVVGTFIRDAALLKSGSELGVNWSDYTTISLALSPKNREGLPVSVAMQAPVPEGAGQ